MNKEELNQKMLDVFYRNPENKDYPLDALNQERNFTQDEFDELMRDIERDFSVKIPMKAVTTYIYRTDGINSSKFTIQQLSDYIQTLLNTQKQ